MKLGNVVNSTSQIMRSDGVSFFHGMFRYFKWQWLKISNNLPEEINLSTSKIVNYVGSGCAPLAFWMNQYDYNNMNFLKAALQETHGLFVDIGANIGTYTLVVSEIQTATVISVEAHPVTFIQLQNNVATNQRENVISRNVAITDYEGVVLFSDYSDSAINMIVTEGKEKSGIIQVPSTTIDNLIDDSSHNHNPVIIKIDVEGYEFSVLNGASRCLPKVSIIQIEGGESPEVQRLLHAYGINGPFYAHYHNKLLNRIPQRRQEDPLYIAENFVSILREKSWIIEDTKIHPDFEFT